MDTNNTINEHDFTLVSVETGRVLAGVWHSDKGEWTVNTVDGSTFRRATREDAISLVAAQYATEVYER